MIHKILSIWLSFCLCSIAFAQDSFQIKGSVINANTLKPIEGANIICENLFATSSLTGKFTIKNIIKGSYIFKISRIGYSPETLTILVGPGMKEVIVSLNATTTALEEVEVHHKTKKRKTKESPIVSHIVSKEFLDKNRENSLMQTLKKIPGVSTINIGSGQSKPVIRGLGFNRISVIQNGIKHEAQQWGSDHGLEIDQYGIKNIQVIKGPASLLYGSDAIAGVVDIQPSKIPSRNSFNGEVDLLAESNNDLLGVSAGIQARKEKWFYRGRLTFRDYGDYKVPTDEIRYENYIFELHNNYLRNTAGKEANVGFSIGYASDKIKSETFFSNVNAKNGFFANAHGLEVRTSSIDYDRSNRDIDLPFHKVNHFKITNNTSIVSGIHTFHFDLGYQNNLREEHSEPVPHGYMPKPSDSKERGFNKHTYSLNGRDVFKLNDKHTTIAGINIEFQENTINGWGFLIPEYSRFTAGAFIYDQFEIRPDLHFQAGLRYDYGFLDTKSYYDWYPSTINNSDGTTSFVNLQRAQNKTLDFGNISTSVGLSYIRKNTTYKINLGKSFRMPLTNELTSDGVNYHMYRYEKGNSDLDVEESYQLDIDIDHTTKKFGVRISPFINFFDNYIYLNPTPNYYETLQIYEYTQSKVFRVGGEISTNITLFKNLQLDASLEYVYSRQTSGPKKDFTLPFSPPLSSLFTASYQFKNLFFLKRPQLMANYRITAAQDEIVPPEERTDGYQVLHMFLLTELDIFKHGPPWKIRLKLNNVFNTKYYDHTSFYRLIDVPEAGRNISVSLTVPF
ncbi:iron complex outermembrane receptor protein [Aquimarina sp. MAR_2010_214]|uniref:TonB-dependent receptor n=1 Tax=Aquimarina sp. MAR_2010_214 TaxID=1250026 RepID=UPI000C70712B|nr:TonB-dependent receptor [Aquimarina sp. MAR_2010_214]PKV50376.1 iron complex outermembrane receptor protein [Aquimarina sp. MAR_2010_214]